MNNEMCFLFIIIFPSVKYYNAKNNINVSLKNNNKCKKVLKTSNVDVSAG